MMKWEEKLRGWLIDHVLWLAWAAVLALGAFLRWSYLPNLAADLEFMNSAWYDAIREGGMKGALAPELLYTYSPLHLYLWRLESLLLPGVSTYTALKGCSLLFEVLNLIVVYSLLKTALPNEKQSWGCFLGCALVWLSPVMLWNVAGWGQTDIFYTLFALLAVLLLLKDKPQWGLVCLGVSLAWKLQAVFLLPLFLIAYFAGRKRFSLFWFLTVPGVMLLTSLPMALIGESPLFVVNIYLGQTGMYSEITYNCPNLYAILGDALQQKQVTLGMFSRTGLCLCVAALGGGGGADHPQPPGGIRPVCRIAGRMVRVVLRVLPAPDARALCHRGRTAAALLGRVSESPGKLGLRGAERADHPERLFGVYVPQALLPFADGRADQSGGASVPQLCAASASQG